MSHILGLSVLTTFFLGAVFYLSLNFYKSILKIDLVDMETFDSGYYLRICSSVADFDVDLIDYHYKTTLLICIQNIEIYYTNLTDKKSYEALKVVPLILKVLAKNSKNDSNSFWFSFGIFSNIINDLVKLKIDDISDEELDVMFKYLSDNIAGTLFEGVQNESFFESYPDVLIHKKYLSYMAIIVGPKIHLLLYEYLLKSTARIENLMIVNHVLEVTLKESFDFVYSLVAAELFKNENISVTTLTNFLYFITKKQLLAKTDLLIMKSILDYF